MPFQFNFNGGNPGVVILFVIVLNIIIGAVTSHVASEKGHDPTGWFFLGFFTGLVALAIICAAPSEYPYSYESDKYERISEKMSKIEDRLNSIDKKLDQADERGEQ